MANRFITSSVCFDEKLNKLSWFDEVFFYRLLTACDNFGRADARESVLKAKIFPLKNITFSQIKGALNSLQSAGIVELYIVDGRPFLQIVDWGEHQQVRGKRSLFPDPPQNVENVWKSCGNRVENSLISNDIKCYHMISSDITCYQKEEKASPKKGEKEPHKKAEKERTKEKDSKNSPEKEPKNTLEKEENRRMRALEGETEAGDGGKDAGNDVMTRFSRVPADISAILQNYAQTHTSNEQDKLSMLALFLDWLEVRKGKRAPLTVRAIDLNLKNLDEYVKETGLDRREYLKAAICRGWQALYQIQTQNTFRGNSRAPETKTSSFDTDDFFKKALQKSYGKGESEKNGI